MRVVWIAAGLLALAGPAAARQATDNPTWIPGQTPSSLTIYGETSLGGPGYRFTERDGNVTDALRPRSLRATGGAWQVCDGANFNGDCRVVEGWVFNIHDLGLRRVRSIQPVQPVQPVAAPT
jgi:hypothetical protein